MARLLTKNQFAMKFSSPGVSKELKEYALANCFRKLTVDFLGLAMIKICSVSELLI